MNVLSALIFFLFSSIVSFFILKFLAANSVTFSKKKIDSQKNERWGNSNKSHLGGIVFSICATVTALIIISQNTFILGEITAEYKSFIGIIFAIIISSIVGIIDEKENMMPLTKLFFQFIIISVLIWAGFVIPISGFFIANVIFTIFWLVLLINALNMFDNVDGALGLFSFMILVLFLIIGIYEEFNINFILLISAYLGAILAFLIYNIYPSKLFMGDIGSLQIASVVGAMSIELFWNTNNSNLFFETTYNLLLQNIVFLVIFLDVLLVSSYRIYLKKSPFKGDTNHLSHAMINIITNPRTAVFVLSLFTLIAILACLSLKYLFLQTSIFSKIILIMCFCMILSAIIFYIYFRGTKNK